MTEYENEQNLPEPVNDHPTENYRIENNKTDSGDNTPADISSEFDHYNTRRLFTTKNQYQTLHKCTGI